MMGDGDPHRFNLIEDADGLADADADGLGRSSKIGRRQQASQLFTEPTSSQSAWN